MQLIALGSSVRLDPIGEPQDILRHCLSDIEERIGTVLAISRLFGTLAWPDPEQPAFVNACVAVRSKLSEADLMSGLLDIELAYGRQRSVPNAPRTLDLDLVASGSVIVQTSHLTLPHPRMHERDFVLEPLCDIAPDWVHPVLQQPAHALLAQIKSAPGYDPTGIWTLEPGL